MILITTGDYYPFPNVFPYIFINDQIASRFLEFLSMWFGK